MLRKVPRWGIAFLPEHRYGTRHHADRRHVVRPLCGRRWASPRRRAGGGCRTHRHRVGDHRVRSRCGVLRPHPRGGPRGGLRAARERGWADDSMMAADVVVIALGAAALAWVTWYFRPFSRR